ncbi:MAG: tetratricopeptide repeat protein, partial [Thiohalophilus sp.]
FIDGITDDLITDLSKVGSIRVIAPQSAYQFKNRKQFTLDDVAKELGVQYVVQGSIQKSGERVRINVQLTNVQDGDIFWAERFDTKSESIFEIQDRITRKVIEAMALTMSESETGRLSSTGTTNFAAYDTFLQGQKFITMRSREGYEMAMDAYQKAIELDPGFARVYGAMSVALTYAYRFQWTDLPVPEAKERSLELAKKALSSNTNSPQIYWALGYVHIHRKEYEEAEEAARKSIELSPNYADGYGLLAYISNWRGKAKQAEDYIKKAIDLNPYHSFDYPWNLGFAYYTQGQYTKAEASLRSALGRNANALYPRLFLAASYVRLGQDEDASWEIDNITVNRPKTTIQHLRNLMPFEHKQDLEKVLGDLEKAGLPK